MWFVASIIRLAKVTSFTKWIHMNPRAFSDFVATNFICCIFHSVLKYDQNMIPFCTCKRIFSKNFSINSICHNILCIRTVSSGRIFLEIKAKFVKKNTKWTVACMLFCSLLFLLSFISVGWFVAFIFVRFCIIFCVFTRRRFRSLLFVVWFRLLLFQRSFGSFLIWNI